MHAEEGPGNEGVIGGEATGDLTLDYLGSWATWYDRHANQNRICYQALKVTEILAAAVVPVVATLSGPGWITATLGGTVVVLESVQGVFQFHDQWLGFRSAQAALRREEHLYLARAGVYASAREPRKLLAARVEQITLQEHTGWRAAHRLRSKGNDEPPHGAV